MHVRAKHLVPLALLGLVAACGSDDSSATTPTSAAPTSAAPAAGASAAAATTGNTLTGTVGEGDAFTIALADSTGAAVSTLKPGSYTVKVSDKSKIHNFHLTGPGVEQTTSVPDVTDVSWTVTLAAGTYTFKCDPHAKMTGSFTVA